MPSPSPARPALVGDSRPIDVVAIDGPGGAGKSTVARLLAARLGARYLDTGAMYRALAWAALRAGIDPNDGSALRELAGRVRIDVDTDPHAFSVRLDGHPVDDQIRSAPVTGAVSAVSAHAGVRTVLVAQQRAIIGTGGIVVEGRDIGTVVVPDAALKVFLTADAGERARRRASERREQGPGQTVEALHRRDTFDSTREAAPLRRAEGARLLDTTELDLDAVVDRLACWAGEVRRGRDG